MLYAPVVQQIRNLSFELLSLLALVVQQIEQRSSEPLIRVQFLSSAQKVM